MADSTQKNAWHLLSQLKDIIQQQELTINRQAERITQLENENNTLQAKLSTSKSSSLPRSPTEDGHAKVISTSTTEEKRHEKKDSISSSVVRRSSSFHKKHLEEQDVRTMKESYELSSDLFDKQIEVLRNKYGGAEKCERAARVIQEAYRRYRMRLNFRKIRKSKNRRLTVENKLPPNEEKETSTQNSQVEVVELVLEQSFDKNDDENNIKFTVGDRNTEGVEGENNDDDENFNRLFESSSEKNTHEHVLSSDTAKHDSVQRSDTVIRVGDVSSEVLSEISTPGIVVNPRFVRRQKRRRHGYETVVLSKDKTDGKDKKDTKSEPKGDDDDGGTLKRNYEIERPPSELSRLSDVDTESMQWQEWSRAGSNMSLASNEGDEESWRSSDTASITSGQSEFSNNVPSEGYQRQSTLSTRGSWHIDSRNDVMRKRLYRIGLNLFNKKPEKGIEFLVEHNFIARTAPAVATFLLNRKGLSRQMVGEYLGNAQKRFNQETLDAVCELMDFSSMEIDEALRDFQRQVKVQGEAQKVDRLVEAFSQRYCTCNPKFAESLKNPDAIFILAFAIIMLNTDLHSPNMKREKRMSEEDFVKNLRGVDGGDDLNETMLVNIYNRIREHELKTGDDHVTQVLNVEKNIIGKKPTILAVPHRRLVCYCRLYQVTDPAKPQKVGVHQRAVFLFNDLLLITKIVQRRRTSTTYGYKVSVPLQGMNVLLFETTYYLFGIRLINTMDNKVLVTFNAPNEHDRNKFVTDLRESINEVQQMENYRIGVELEKAQLPVDGRNSLTRDSKILSASMHNLNEMRASVDSAPPFIGMERPSSMYDLGKEATNKNNSNIKNDSNPTKSNNPISFLLSRSDASTEKSDQSILSTFKMGKRASKSPQTTQKVKSNGKTHLTIGYSNI